MDILKIKSVMSFTSAVIAIVCITIALPSIAAVDIKNVQARFENATIVMDKNTGIPSRISSMNYQPKILSSIKMPVEDKNVESVLKAFLDENKEVLLVDSTNLKLVSKTRRKDKWYVKYQQLYQGIPVLNATVGLIGTDKGGIINYTATYRPAIKIDTKEAISKEKAIEITKATYDEKVASQLKIRKIEKVIFTAKQKEQHNFYLAWRIDVISKIDRVKNDLIFIVDAKTGKILKQYRSRFFGSHAHGTVRGEIYPENPTDAITTEPLAYERVKANGFFWSGTTNTDQSGNYAINTPWWAVFFDDYQANYQLIGPYAQVLDNAGNDYTENNNCEANHHCTFTWTATDRDHVNVFYHLNVMHDWYQSHLGYNWINSWDNTSRFNAEVNHTYNNAHAGDPMGFGTNNYARSSDVVYHEASHNVLHALYGDYVGFPAMNDESYAFDEGFADYFAGALTEDPQHGEGYGGTRTLINNNQYTDKATYNIEGHTGGTIIAGAAWDIREALQVRLGDAQGANIVDNLMFDALIAMAAQPRDYYFSDPQESNFLSSLYIAADDNNNLLDGVPYFYDIQNAFADHNLLQAQLLNRNSYDVSTNSLGILTGGDFYYSGGAFWSNNVGQRGVQDLGDIGAVALEDVNIPATGYTRQQVNAVVNHTYVALAQTDEEGSYIVFRVTDHDAANNEVVIQYRYRTPLYVGPVKLCDRHPRLCREIYPCRKYPSLCGDTPALPDRDGLIIEFEDIFDHVVVPVDKICQYVLDCPGCGPSGYCPGYDMQFNDMPDVFGLSIYTSQGQQILNNTEATMTKRLQFKADKGLDYYLVITPGKDSQMQKQYNLPLKVNGKNITSTQKK